MRKIAESTVRRLSLYLRFLEEFEEQGVDTVSSEALATRGGTTSAQVRKDLSFFGSFGKRGLGYSVPELASRVRDILGLGKIYRVAVIGAGNIGVALVHFRGFEKHGFRVVSLYDADPKKIGRKRSNLIVRDQMSIEVDISQEPIDMA
ncbi:MAG: redox-sensing transcriptional repressor Rex, partial [Gemmatimonadales bacterium]